MNRERCKNCNHSIIKTSSGGTWFHIITLNFKCPPELSSTVAEPDDGNIEGDHIDSRAWQ